MPDTPTTALTSTVGAVAESDCPDEATAKRAVSIALRRIPDA
ncbi:hypothetical protein [Candidatus Poriferisodalis sp.]